jgi:antitoxin (DNA-binding transcriptional repressor) of toxin-antitoxin stability system
MQTVTLEKAQATLADLLSRVAGGEEFTITENGEPKATLSAPQIHQKTQARAGSLKGKIWMAPDFDAPRSETI